MLWSIRIDHMKKRLRFVIKLLVSTGLMVYIISGIDLDTISIDFTTASIGLFILAVTINVSNNFFGALRVNSLTSEQTKIANLTRVNFIGSFFSLFLPTNFGGDVFRVRFLRPKLNDYGSTSAVIFLDRFLGLCVLLIFAILGSWYLATVESITFPIIIYGFLLAATAGAILIWLSLVSDVVISKINQLKTMEKLTQAHAYVNKISMIQYTKAIFWAFVMQVNTVMYNFLLAQVIGLEIPIYYFIAVIPITNLLLTIPISVNGIGLRDLIFVNLFERSGAADNVVLLGPLNVFGNVINGLIGGAVYMFTDREKLWSDKDHNTTSK